MRKNNNLRASGQNSEGTTEFRDSAKVTNFDDRKAHTARGVARNLLRRGQKKGSGDESPPAGSSGRAPVGSGAKSPKAVDTC